MGSASYPPQFAAGISYAPPLKADFFDFLRISAKIDENKSFQCPISLPKGNLMSLNTFLTLFWYFIHFFDPKSTSEVVRSFKNAYFGHLDPGNYRKTPPLTHGKSVWADLVQKTCNCGKITCFYDKPRYLQCKLHILNTLLTILKLLGTLLDRYGHFF